jgi:hypothetical protein
MLQAITLYMSVSRPPCYNSCILTCAAVHLRLPLPIVRRISHRLYPRSWIKCRINRIDLSPHRYRRRNWRCYRQFYQRFLLFSTETFAQYLIYWNPRYGRLVAQYAPEPVPPEYRLEPAVWATVPYAVAFFWFGWTSYPEISLWAPLSQGIIMGWSINWLFVSNQPMNWLR